MVAKHDSLRGVDIGNRSHHVDVFIPKITNEQSQILILAFQKLGICSAPLFVDVTDD
jgi:hypothetical protein